MDELNKDTRIDEELKEAETVVKETVDANSSEEDILTEEDVDQIDKEANEKFDNMMANGELPDFTELLRDMFSGVDLNDPSMTPVLTVEKTYTTVDLPKYAHPGDAGMDVCAAVADVIEPHTWKLIHTGIKVAVPEGMEIQVRPRSGLALKHGITVLNTPGTIDSGYRGEIGVILMNHSDKRYIVKKGDRIAQLVVAPFISVRVIEGEVDKVTERGEGGFGSTGVSKEETKHVSEEGSNKEV